MRSTASLFLSLAFSLTVLSNAHSQGTAVKVQSEPARLEYDFYSETLSSVLFSGLTTQSRLRLFYPIPKLKLNLYAGVNTSNDLTTGTSLRYADDFVSPTFGFLFKPFKFIGVFAEYRRLFRTETIVSLPSVENDTRLGAYIYKKYAIFSSRYKPFAELYGESVALTRFSSSPVSTVWLKLGTEHNLTKNFVLAAYLEGFVRDSPSLLIGITDQNINAGLRFKWVHKNFSAQILGYNRIYTEEVPTGWEGLLVLSANGGLF
jgi:hypothetical protein